MGFFNQGPYTNFHDLNLDWILKKMHEWGIIIDELDVTIQALIDKKLDDINLNQLILDALTQYGIVINVKAPPTGLIPSKGDGTTDDTLSIQGCIDYAYEHGGMTVFFPSGSYLTGSLTVKNKVAMVGLSQYNTKIVLKGGAVTSLLGGSNIETCITGLHFDSNGEFQVNDVDTINMIVEKATIANCIFTQAENLAVITANQELVLDNILFNGASKKCLAISGNGDISCSKLRFKNLSTIVGVCFVEINSNKTIMKDCYMTGSAPKSLIINGSNNTISYYETVNNSYTDDGVNNSVEVLGVSVSKKLTGNMTVEIGGSENEKVSGIKTTTVTGIENKTVNGKENITNNAGFQRDVIGTNKTVADVIDNVSDEFIINSIEPLTYKTPVTFDPSFSTIPFKDSTGNVYNVMVNKQTMERRTYHVRDFGAVGDGVTDDTDAIQACVNYNSTDLLKTVIMDTGRYHTSRSIILPPNIFITCEQNGGACFLDAFPGGTFKLSSNCWIENLLMLGSVNAGFAFYGTGVQSVSFKNVQNSGATSGAANPVSGFVKLEGDFSIIMFDSCLGDSGGPTGFSFEFLGQDNWHGGNIFGDRDIFFRNCFLDNFQPVDNQGGLFYMDSIKDVRFQGCILRSSSNTFVEASTHTEQSTTVYATNCIIERSTTTGYGITLPANTFFENLGNVLGPSTYVLNNGVFTNYNSSNCVRLPVISDSYFTKDTGVDTVKNGNGTFSFHYYSSAIDTNQGIWKNINSQMKFARVGLNYYGKTIASTRYGIGLRNSTTGEEMLFCIVPDTNSMNVSIWTGFGSTYSSDVVAPIKIDPAGLQLAIEYTDIHFNFLYSKDGVYWSKFGGVTSGGTYDKIGFFANCGQLDGATEVNNYIEVQVNYFTENV